MFFYFLIIKISFSIINLKSAFVFCLYSYTPLMLKLLAFVRFRLKSCKAILISALNYITVIYNYCYILSQICL